MKRLFYTVTLFLCSIAAVFAQGDRPDKTAVTFEQLFDEPYAINKLFIGFQPLYGEAFATNINAGFGIEASFYYRDKMDFKAHMRKTYGRTFYDFNRDLAFNNSNVDNTPSPYYYFEVGGTYHIKDWESSSKTKMVLYKNSYKGNKWAGRVPLHAEVPCKVRKIYGARLGTVIWNSTTDINRALNAQDLSNADLVNESGEGLPMTINNPVTNQPQNFNVYTNINAANIYVGGSLAWFRNVAVSFDNYEGAVDDGLLTLYFDILYAPYLELQEVEYNGIGYSTGAIKTSPLGLRLGVDGKFNRILSWGYGGEVGYRPGISGRSFFAMFKISFPVFGTNLDYKVESFGKE